MGMRNSSALRPSERPPCPTNYVDSREAFGGMPTCGAQSMSRGMRSETCRGRRAGSLRVSTTISTKQSHARCGISPLGRSSATCKGHRPRVREASERWRDILDRLGHELSVTS